MQHSSKAGGTTLCINVRLDVFGLVMTHPEDRQKRITCQIVTFRSDYDMKKKKRFSELIFPSMLKNAMNKNSQNFIELEGSGVPFDMSSLVDPGSSQNTNQTAWRDFVFISTMRHPIDRIGSLLKSDICSNEEPCFKRKKIHS